LSIYEAVHLTIAAVGLVIAIVKLGQNRKDDRSSGGRGSSRASRPFHKFGAAT